MDFEVYAIKPTAAMLTDAGGETGTGQSWFPLRTEL